MTYQIDCPACRQNFYFPSLDNSYENFVESICTKCKYKYTFEQGKITTFNPVVEAFQSRTYNNKITAKYKRTYQIHLLNENKAVKSLEFSFPGQQENIAALPGDKLLLLYTVSKTNQKDLVLVKNQRTAQNYQQQKPDEKALSIGIKAGLIFFAASAVVAATLLHISPFNKVFLATATPSAIGVAVYVTKRTSNKVSDRSELLRLTSEQQLLEQKFKLEQKSEVLLQEIKNDLKVIKRFKKLREEMLNTDKELYNEQIAVISKGINILENNLLLSQTLVIRYKHICNMLDIDYETSSLIKQLPNDITVKISGQLEELKAIETQKETMSLLVNSQRLLD